MNKNRSLVLLASIIFSFLISSCSLTKPKYYIGGSGWNKIALVDAQGTQYWSHQLEKEQECNSVTHFSKGKLLYSFKQGAKLIDENHQTIWEYRCDEGAEIHSASSTDEGNILLGICGNPAKIMEFSPKGEKLVDIPFETGVKRPHGQFRKISKTAEGTYLIPLMKKKTICEIDANGKIVRELNPGIFVFSLVVLKSGNWLLSCGDTHKLIEINPTTQEVVWELNETDVAGLPLRFVAEAVRLENGNTIVCNWGGHAKGAEKVAQLFEIDKNKNLIWKIEDYQNYGNISTLDLVTDKK